MAGLPHPYSPALQVYLHKNKHEETRYPAISYTFFVEKKCLFFEICFLEI